MSTDTKKTLAFVGIALLLTGGAVLSRPSSRTMGPQDYFRAQGEPFFPKFTDPNACTSLEVISYDPDTASAQPFKVMLKDGKWVIPSHHDYPADAKDRLSKTASGVIDLKKDVIVSDRLDDQEKLGVVDPLDEKATGLKGIGKRITLRNQAGEVLADFIIGNEVPNRPGMRYVRVPGEKLTYAVNVNVDLSTRFGDWIETNLLNLDTSRVRKIVFDNYKVIPELRRIRRGEVLTVARKDAAAPWTMEGLAPTKELNTEKINTLITALGDLKIVGVRTKPAGLTRELKLTGKVGADVSDQSYSSLFDLGFYVTPQGLFSNQGDVKVETDEGVVYILRFGEVTFAKGEALTAGTPEKGAKSGQAKKEAAKKEEGGVESRYLFVTAQFDPSLIPTPPPPSVDQLEFPDDPFQREPDDPKRVAEEKAAQEKADREKQERERKIEEGKKRVESLNDRFAAWYYVVPGDSFRDIDLDRAALERPLGSGNSSPTAPGGLPPGLNLPPGLGNPSGLR